MSKSKVQSVIIDHNDLALFRMVAIIFLLAKISSIGFNFISPLFGSVVSEGGTIVLAIGIVMLARKYPPLTSGTMIAILFVISAAVGLLSAIDSFLTPSPKVSSGNATQLLISTYQALVPRIYFILTISFISGIVIFLSAYYFTHWFNDAFGEYKPTKAFLLYGIFTGLGEILAALGEYLIIGEIKSLGLNANSTSQELGPLFPYILLITIGGALSVAGIISLIVASVKIYYRVNDKYIGDISFNQKNSAYRQSYVPNVQLGHQGKDNSTENLSSANCKNCGAPLEQNATFCQFCGTKV